MFLVLYHSVMTSWETESLDKITSTYLFWKISKVLQMFTVQHRSTILFTVVHHNIQFPMLSSCGGNVLTVGIIHSWVNVQEAVRYLMIRDENVWLYTLY